MWSKFNDMAKTAGKNRVFLAGLFLVGGTTQLLAATAAQCEAALRTRAPQPEINFGSMMEYGAGTVTVSPGGARSATGGVVLLGGTPTAARFRVRVNRSGCFGINPLCISLPDTDLTEPGSDTMRMTNYKIDVPALGISDAALPTQIDLPDRTWVDVDVGANIPVSSGQTAGSYTANYTITFTYLNCP